MEVVPGHASWHTHPEAWASELEQVPLDTPVGDHSGDYLESSGGKRKW